MSNSDRGQTSVPDSSPWHQIGHHWVSSLNYDVAVQKDYAFSKPLVIYDSTLRKIMLTNGLRPSLDDMLRVAEALEEVGVREIIFNVDWWGDPKPEKLEYAVCKAVLARGFAFRTTVYSDSYVPYPIYDMEHYLVSGQQVVDTLLEIGTTIIQPTVGYHPDPAVRERQWERLVEVCSYAKSHGISWVPGITDVGRADFEWLVQTCNEGIRLGAIRIDLLDSYNSLSPEAMKLFITRFRARLVAPVPVTMHVHDDFGIGSAVAVAAATAGAHPDVAVNGLSYRSGHAALEEVVMTLELLYGVKTGIRLDRLQWLSDVVAKHSGMPTHPLKAITGSQAYLRDLPPWKVPYLRSGPGGFPPPGVCWLPSMVGGQMRAVWGNHHSDWVIREKLVQMELSASEEQVAEIRRRIEAGVNVRDSYPRWLTEEEVEEICHTVAK